jgi:sugar lactone lactonase YvrE
MFTHISYSDTRKILTMTKFIRYAISGVALVAATCISSLTVADESATSSSSRSIASATSGRGQDAAAIITTIAGTGSAGYAGNSGLATSATLAKPRGVTFDRQGNLYIADTENNVVRKVDANGIITTVAGTGEGKYFGDNIPAVRAQLNSPFAVAVDKDGNLYIADAENGRIRKVDRKGIITTVAGNGINGDTGDGGPATNASLYAPYDIAVDEDGNLYIADFNNNRIRKVDAHGIITTVAGDGQFGDSGDNGPAIGAELDHPCSVALDGHGNIYIADDNYVIHKVAPSGIITTVAGNRKKRYSGDNMLAKRASLIGQAGIAVDADGNLFIADSGNHRIRKVSARTGIITTVAGNGKRGYSGDNFPAINAEINEPIGIAIDVDGNLYVADSKNNRVRKIAHTIDMSR